MHIITHPGRAHADEVCAQAVLLALYGDKGYCSKDLVERRDPTDEELEDPNIWVIDVGGEYSPEKGNFDHHQMPPESQECAFTLVLRHLGLLDAFEEAFEWVRPLAIRDSQGPKALANYAGVGFEGFKALGPSPLEQALLGLFGVRNTLCGVFYNAWEEDPLFAILKRMGEEWIKSARSFCERKTRLKAGEAHRVTTPGGLTGVYIASRENFVRELNSLVKEWEENGYKAQFSIVADPRGDGYSLYRYEGAPLNFSQLEGDPRVKFAHKGGFLAVTEEPLPLDELLELVDMGGI